jgi:hypothetical protein
MISVNILKREKLKEGVFYTAFAQIKKSLWRHLHNSLTLAASMGSSRR